MGGEFVERVGKACEGRLVAVGSAQLGRQLRDMEGGAALECAPFAHQIDDQAAHDSGRIADEALAIGKYIIFSRHVEVGFVKQCGRANRRPGAAAQLPLGELPQIAVQGGKPQAVRRIGIGWIPGPRGRILGTHPSSPKPAPGMPK